MNNEEKKVIEWLKKADWFSARLYSPTILNLIEKQQKEIEELKEKNKKAIDFINERKKTVNKDMAEGTRLQVGTFMWQVDELLEILKEE